MSPTAPLWLEAGEDEILQLLDSANTVHLTITWSSQDQLLRAYRGWQTGTLLASSASRSQSMPGPFSS